MAARRLCGLRPGRLLVFVCVLAVLFVTAVQFRDVPVVERVDVVDVTDVTDVGDAPSDVPSDPPADPPADPPTHCPDYTEFARSRDGKPRTGGRFDLPLQRPAPACRRFVAPEVEAVIEEMRGVVRDPDLFRLFENCFPSTLDTAVAWQEEREDEEELAFITTGDIPAMWLRDSANQLASYRALLRASPARASLAGLFRGALALQARWLARAPHCNAFQPPAAATAATGGALAPQVGFGGGRDAVHPAIPLDDDGSALVYECKFELDALAAFLQLSHDYYAATGDAAFFARGGGATGPWARAVDAILATAEAMQAGTYAADGRVLPAPYRFQRQTTEPTETLAHGGAGAPVAGGTGLVRSGFRPSDDACTYPLLVPANMLFARCLEACAEIMGGVEAGDPGGDLSRNTSARMTALAAGIRAGIARFGTVDHGEHGRVFAYEVDGFGSHLLMDDANLPSLLGAPLAGFVDRADAVYQNTRRLVLSGANPYWMRGPVLNATGGPHVGPGMAWPMALVVQLLTEDDDGAIVAGLGQLLAATDGLGLMHEAVSSHDAGVWTRPWFSWANGLFGQLLLDLRARKPHLLETSFQ